MIAKHPEAEERIFKIGRYQVYVGKSWFLKYEIVNANHHSRKFTLGVNITLSLGIQSFLNIISIGNSLITYSEGVEEKRGRKKLEFLLQQHF